MPKLNNNLSIWSKKHIELFFDNLLAEISQFKKYAYFPGEILF